MPIRERSPHSVLGADRGLGVASPSEFVAGRVMWAEASFNVRAPPRLSERLRPPPIRRGVQGVGAISRVTRAAPSARGRGPAPRTSSLHQVSLGLIEHGLGTWNGPRHPGHHARASPSSEPRAEPPAPRSGR